MPASAIRSITSPEQGAQHECNKTFLDSLGISKTILSLAIDQLAPLNNDKNSLASYHNSNCTKSKNFVIYSE